MKKKIDSFVQLLQYSQLIKTFPSSNNSICPFVTFKMGDSHGIRKCVSPSHVFEYVLKMKLGTSIAID